MVVSVRYEVEPLASSSVLVMVLMEPSPEADSVLVTLDVVEPVSFLISTGPGQGTVDEYYNEMTVNPTVINDMAEFMLSE